MMEKGDMIMSKSEKKKQETTESQEKVLTRYDLKMQRRQAQKKKEAREKKIGTAVGILLVAALVCLVASFPIRNWLTVHGTYIVAAGEKVSRVEYDFHYNMVLNSFQNSEEGMYLTYSFGLDLTGDLSQQMYSDTLTWKDYFDEMAVDNLIRTKALQREMDAAGFQYDAEEEFREYEETLRQSASDAGMNLNAYTRQLFGPYATLSRVDEFIKEGLRTNAYFDHVAESKGASDEEIQAYYESNTDNYDSVDYRMMTVNAELPTEPTELADPVDESQEDGDAAAEGEETAYQPSDAEIEAAMAVAKEEADARLSTISSEGELFENMLRTDLNSLVREWIMDQSRKQGDTTVIEDDTSHCYYVVEFVDRYLDQTPSIDARIIMTQEDNGQTILDEWQAGEATEESFADLADQYSGITTTEGGLFEGLVPDGVPQELADWLFDQEHTNGEVAVIPSESSTVNYVVYYIGENDPRWKLSIAGTLLDTAMSEYIDSITEGLEAEDPHDHLHYLEVQAQAESDAAQDGDAAADEEGGADGSSAE